MADRGFSSTIETALSSTEVAIDFLVYLNWPSAALYFWSGRGTISWNSQSWVGVGNLGTIDKVAESVDESDIGLQLTLNYLDDTLRNEVITHDPVGADAVVYLAVMNKAAGTVVDAYPIFTGFIDQCDIQDSGTTGSVNVRLASELARLARPRYYTLSDAHQQYLFPGDIGMEFAPLMDQPMVWGRQTFELIRPIKPVPVLPPLMPIRVPGS